MNVQNIKTKDLVPYLRNQKKHDKKQIDNVAESIKQFGIVQPIVVDKDNNVIIGHCRLLACQKLKIEEVPVVKLEELTPEQANKLRLLDNKLNESDWDFDILTEDIPELDWEGFDIDWELPESITEETKEEEKEIIEDEVPEKVKDVTKLGNLFEIGNHRLICGDSTDKNVIDKLMDEKKAQMTFSDAPYNISFKGSMSNTTKNGVMIKHKGANQRHDAIKNDTMSKDDFKEFCLKFLENIKRNVRGGWYLSFSSVNLEELLNPLREKNMDWKSIIIWQKNQATLSMKDYKSRYEPIVYGRFDDVFYGEKAKEEDIWEFQRTLKNDLHPTMKPIPLICNMLRKSSKQGDSVLDLFGGSGSTLIACEQLNRKCYMCELDPHYCDVIINRYMNLTGKDDVYLIKEDGVKIKYTELIKEDNKEDN